jgi:hypothetical protein
LELTSPQMTLSEIIPIRKFFTDEQWDMIYDALREYQDHDDEIDQDLLSNTIDQISDLFNEDN